MELLNNTQRKQKEKAQLESIVKKKQEIQIIETENMPNNRFVYTLAIWSDFYLDINIIRVPNNNEK